MYLHSGQKYVLLKYFLITLFTVGITFHRGPAHWSRLNDPIGSTSWRKTHDFVVERAKHVEWRRVKTEEEFILFINWV